MKVYKKMINKLTKRVLNNFKILRLKKIEYQILDMIK